MAKKKVEPLSIRFSCNDQEFDLPVDQLFFGATYQECEICGSHGNVEVGFVCPVCKQYHTVELYSW